jgi:hypothetical protein
MNAIATLQQNYIDVEFTKLNDLTARVRIAGAKISVKKLGKLHRIILLQEPSIASVEQVLKYSNNVASIEEKFDETVFTNDLPAIIAANDSSETILLPKELELAPLDELQNLPLAQLKKLAATHKISGRSKMSAPSLAQKLQSLVTKSELL